jgi:hypothetical protein
MISSGACLSNSSLGNTRADIVFLHGLGGDWEGTWKHKASNGNPEFFWPKELAKEYKYAYTVWSLQYPAGLIDFQTKTYDQKFNQNIMKLHCTVAH